MTNMIVKKKKKEEKMTNSLRPQNFECVSVDQYSSASVSHSLASILNRESHSDICNYDTVMDNNWSNLSKYEIQLKFPSSQFKLPHSHE